MFGVLGEYPEEYEDGEFSEAPDVWIAGVASAEAGVLMPAEPRLGTSSYRQGLALDIEFVGSNGRWLSWADD